ncbi:STAS domain-containing protein [Streptomyces tricolor]
MTNTHETARPGLSIGVERIDGTRVVILRGEIDHDNRDRLKDALLPPESPDPAHTVADFDDVTFMDSTGINVLITAHRAAQDAGGWLRLARPREPVLRVLELVGVNELIPCCASLREALDG